MNLLFLLILGTFGVSKGATTTLELTDELFVQSSTSDLSKGVRVVWIPEPVRIICRGKSLEKCTDIDFCIRLTDKNDSRCKSLGLDVKSLPQYPQGIQPRRLLSVFYFRGSTFQGSDALFKLADRLKPEDLKVLSITSQFKGKVRLQRDDDDDSFQLEGVL